MPAHPMEAWCPHLTPTCLNWTPGLWRIWGILTGRVAHVLTEFIAAGAEAGILVLHEPAELTWGGELREKRSHRSRGEREAEKMVA